MHYHITESAYAQMGVRYRANPIGCRYNVYLYIKLYSDSPPTKHQVPLSPFLSLFRRGRGKERGARGERYGERDGPTSVDQ